jgi:multiple sugar transport system substrate-binding protein
MTQSRSPRLLLLCLVSTLCAGLAGCVPREDKQIKLRAAFWSPPGVEEEIARRFEAQHPGVKVDLMITGGRYAEKLQSMIVAGNEPDILMAQDVFFHDWAARDVFLDVSALANGMQREDPFMPAPFEIFAGKRHYVVPTDCNVLVTYGNLDAAAYAKTEYPWKEFTWSQLEALGPTLTRRANPSSPTEFLCALPPEPYFFVAYGARCIDDPWHPTEVVVESPETLGAIEFWRRIHQRGWAVPRSTVLDQGESEMFRDGRIAFIFWGRNSTKFIRANPALHWNAAPIPHGPVNRGVPHMTSSLGISRRTKHPELAREFLKFYLTDAAVEVPVKAGHIVPVRRRQATGPLFLSQHPPASLEPYIAPLEAGGLTNLAYCPGRLELEEIVRKRFEQSLSEPSMPAEVIMKALAADVRAWLAKQKQKGLL